MNYTLPSYSNILLPPEGWRESVTMNNYYYYGGDPNLWNLKCKTCGKEFEFSVLDVAPNSYIKDHMNLIHPEHPTT